MKVNTVYYIVPSLYKRKQSGWHLTLHHFVLYYFILLYLIVSYILWLYLRSYMIYLHQFWIFTSCHYFQLIAFRTLFYFFSSHLISSHLISSHQLLFSLFPFFHTSLFLFFIVLRPVLLECIWWNWFRIGRKLKSKDN